jgi:hypothetical protein
MAGIENPNRPTPTELLQQIGIKPVLAKLAGNAVCLMDRLGIATGANSPELASDRLFELIPRFDRMATCNVVFKPGQERAFDPGSLNEILGEYFSESNGHVPHALINPQVGVVDDINAKGQSNPEVMIMSSPVEGIVDKKIINNNGRTAFFVYNTPQGFNLTFDHSVADALQVFPLLQRILTRTEFVEQPNASTIQGREPLTRIIDTNKTQARDLLKAAALAGTTQKGQGTLLYITHLAKEKRIIPYPVPTELILDEERRRKDLPKMLNQQASMGETPIAQVVDMMRLKRLPPSLTGFAYRVASALTPTSLLPKIGALTGIGPVQRYEHSPKDINPNIGDSIASISIDLHMYPHAWDIPLLFRVAIDLPGDEGIVPIRTVSISGLPEQNLEEFAQILEGNLR